MSLLLKYILPLLVLSHLDVRCSYQARTVPNKRHFYTSNANLLPAQLKKIVIDADIVFDNQEFSYLTGLKKEIILSSKMLHNALNMLMLKNKFSYAHALIEPLENQCIALRIMLKSLWTFNKVRVNNFLSSNEQYRLLYCLSACQPFYYNDHTKAIQSIKNALERDGYLNATIKSAFLLDRTSKTVDVNLTINKGRRYTTLFKHISFDKHCEKLHRKINKKCKKALHNRYYSLEQITKFIDYLQIYFAKNGFFNSKTFLKQKKDATNSTISIDVIVELKKREKFYFEGNVSFSSAVLQTWLDVFMHNHKSIHPYSLAHQIRELYHNQEFLKATVIPRKMSSGSVLFTINENKKYTLKNIVCTFNAQKALLTLLEEQSIIFKQQGIQRGLQSLYQHVKNFYIKQGYWNPLVIIKIVCHSNDYQVEVNVEQGEQWLVKEIIFSGFPADVWPTINQPYHQPLHPDLIEQQKQLLTKHLQENGYFYATLGYTIEQYDAKSSYKTIKWTVTGFNKKTYFGKFILQGPTPLFLDDIKKELLFKEHQLYDQKLLSESLYKLLNLSVFESVNIQIHDSDTPQQKKHIIARLIYDDPCELRVRAGFQQVSKTFLAFSKGTTYKCGGSFLYKSITQLGDMLLLDGDITRFYRNISLSYQRPWLLASVPLRSLIKGYSNRYVQPLYIGSDKPLYQALEQGCLIGLRRKWSHVDMGSTVGVEWMETSHLSQELAYAIDFIPLLIDRRVPYIFAEYDIAFNYLDNQLDPSEGFLSVISFKLMIPYAFSSLAKGFLRCIADTSLFIRLMDNLVLGIRTRAGHIITHQLSSVMPPERFYLGGQNSIRSYQPDFCPPLGMYTTAKKIQYVPQGGHSLANSNIELRYTFWKQLGIVLFHDIGALAHDKNTYSFSDNLVQATGCGLRYLTPIGPARFDIAWKWKKAYPEESWYAWYMTLGHAF